MTNTKCNIWHIFIIRAPVHQADLFSNCGNARTKEYMSRHAAACLGLLLSLLQVRQMFNIVARSFPNTSIEPGFGRSDTA